MTNIVKIENEIAVVNQFKGNAIKKRIAMVNIPEVQDLLTMAEKSIFLATTKIQIKDIEKGKLFEDLKKMLPFLLKDLGIRTEPDSYDYARFYDVVSRYFSELSFPEIKIAFEMSMIGELDNFLSRNGNGEPDKGHYQRFSFEYITKILNAYKKRRNVLLKKAYDCVPNDQKMLPSSQIELMEKESVANLRNIALKYKYSGKLEFIGLDDKLMYDRLVSTGYANEIVINPDDMSLAMASLIQSALFNQAQKYNIDKFKHEHEDVKIKGYVLARRKEIIRALNECNRVGIQIKDYIK